MVIYLSVCLSAAIFPQNATKFTKICSSEFGGLLWCHLATQKNCNRGAQLQSLLCTTVQKIFWKIYFLYTFGAHKLAHY